MAFKLFLLLAYCSVKNCTGLHIYVLMVRSTVYCAQSCNTMQCSGSVAALYSALAQLFSALIRCVQCIILQCSCGAVRLYIAVVRGSVAVQ